MEKCRPGMFEYHPEGEIHHEFNRHGARYPSYNTIVGSGENGCILHYTENESELRDGDLVLIDAGCEYKGYAGDITRTFPVNGKFTPPSVKSTTLCWSLLKPACGCIVRELPCRKSLVKWCASWLAAW